MSCIDVRFSRAWHSKLRGAGASIAVLLTLLFPHAEAGIVVGMDSGNDKLVNVQAVVSAYNAANNPDLPTAFSLFKKSDDHASFVFNPSNGFHFYSDALGTTPITTDSSLHSVPTAYFSYTGPENLLYYSVKAANEFKVYAFTAGLNIVNLSSHDISHMSFWVGEGIPTAVPEPSTCALAIIGVGLLAGKFGVRRLRGVRRSA